MRELGLALSAAFIIGGFFSLYIYPSLEYKNYPRNSSCTGECYEEYVKNHGTVVEQLVAKQEAAAKIAKAGVQPGVAIQ